MKSGVPYGTTVSYLSNNTREPRAGYVADLSKALGVSADWLLQLSDTSQPTPLPEADRKRLEEAEQQLAVMRGRFRKIERLSKNGGNGER